MWQTDQVAWEGPTPRLPCQEPSFSAKHIDEIIGHRPHARNFRKVAAYQEPYVAVRRTFPTRDPHETLIVRYHVSREECDAVARACRRSLRRVAVSPN
jgi:hypothetical protein